MPLVPEPINCDESVKRAIRAISRKLGYTGSPIYAGLTLTGLTATRLTATNADKELVSSDLANWVTGTANEIDVADDGDGTITIGIVNPLIVAKGGSGAAAFTDHSILLGSGTESFTALGLAPNGYIPIGFQNSDPVLASITQTANQVLVTNGAGTITLSTPQDIHTGATPTFAGLTLSAIAAEGADVDKFLVDSTGVIKYRTGAQVLSDIGGQALSDVLDDLNTLGVVASDSQMIVGTGAGAFAYESGATLRTSIGVGTGDSVTFAGLTITGNSVFGLNSSVFQPTTDSTTFFQVLDADGGTPVLNVDSTNEIVLVGASVTAGVANVKIEVTTPVVNARANIHVYGNNNMGGFVSEDTRALGEACALLSGTTHSVFSFSNTGKFGIFQQSKADVLATPGASGLIWDINCIGLTTWYGDRSQFQIKLDQNAGNDIVVGTAFYISGTNDNLNIFTNPEKSVGSRVVGLAASPSYWYSMWEYENVGSGEPVLSLVRSGGTVGIGENAPETQVEMTNTQPYLTLHNSTHEDTDGGGESRLIFKREDGAGTETAAGQIEISHDGSGANDQLGKMIFSVNTGAGLAQALEIGSDLLATFAGSVTGTNLNIANWDTAYSHSQLASGNPHSVTPTELSLLIGTNTQAWDAGLDSIATLAYASDSFIKVTATDTYAIRTIAETKTDLSLNNVENTTHSTDAHTMTIDGVDVSAHAALNIHTAVADESADTECYVSYFIGATGDLAPKTGTNLTFNSSTGILTATGFAGALTGNVTGDCTGSSGSCTGESATVATIDGLAPNTATTQATQASITTCANLVTVGTIGTGVWNAGAVTSSGVGVFEGASVTVGKASTTTGTLVLHDSNSANTITLTVPDISAGSLTFTLPPTDGANTNVLQTDGNGVLTWAAAGAGGGTDEKVKVDVGATADYIGAANSDGVLRTTTGLSYVDGGNFVTLGLSHLGFESLTSPTPNDRIPFWDNSASAFAWLSPSTGLGISTTSLGLNFGALVEETTPDVLDVVCIYDPTGGAHHKVKLENLNGFQAPQDEDDDEDQLAAGTVYQAATDGFVTAWAALSANNLTITGKVGAANPPTTTVAYQEHQHDINVDEFIGFPVPKDYYWKVDVVNGTLTEMIWTPMGSGSVAPITP